MIIHTIGGTYRVVRTLAGSAKLFSYLCVREGTSAEHKFLVIGPKERELSEKMLFCFMEWKEERTSFRARTLFGLEECFAREGVVWVVFRYFEGTEWTSLIGSRMLLEERRKLAQELMEQMFTRKLPQYLQYEASDLRNIVADKGRGIRVNYLLFAPEKIAEELFYEVQRRTASCLRELFAEEIREEKGAEPGHFIKRLEGAEFSGEVELYRAYRRMEETLQNIQTEGTPKQKGYLVRLWQRVISYSEHILGFLYWMLIGGLLGLLVYVCVMPERAPEERLRFERIGTLPVAVTEDTER